MIGLVPLPEETILTVTVNGRVLVRLACSPFDQKELVVGWLYTQGIIESDRDITGLAIGPRCLRARVGLAPATLKRIKDIQPFRASGCAGGSADAGQFERLRPLERPYGLEVSALVGLAREMLRAALRFHEHGGIHAAMLADVAKLRVLSCREDIGRSNAVDKVIGWGLLAHVDFAGTALFTTGRITSEMILKAARARIPVAVSLTTFTTRTLAAAKITGQTLAGHILKPRPILVNW